MLRLKKEKKWCYVGGAVKTCMNLLKTGANTPHKETNPGAKWDD